MDSIEYYKRISEGEHSNNELVRQLFKMWEQANIPGTCPNNTCGVPVTVIQATDVNPNLVASSCERQLDITDPENPERMERPIYRCPRCLCFMGLRVLFTPIGCGYTWVMCSTKEQYDANCSKKGWPIEATTGPTGGA